MRTRVAVAVAALLVPLASCSGAEQEPAASEVGAASASVDPLAGSEEVPVEQFTDALYRGAEQASTARMELLVRVGRGRLAGAGVVDYSVDPTSASVALAESATPDKPTDALVVDGTCYLRKAGESWHEASGDGNALLVAALDPLATLGSTVSGVTSALHVLREVDGETWHEYTARIDTDGLSALTPGLQDELDEREQVNVQWTFDEAGDTRSIRADYGDTLGDFEYTFEDWGTAVDIQPPPTGV